MNFILKSNMSIGRMLILVLAGLTVAVFSGPARIKADVANEPPVTHTVNVVDVSGAPGAQVLVSIELDSGGDEVAGSFTVNFDPSKLSISGVSSPGANPDVALGTGVPAGSALTVNGNQAANGRIGVVFDSSNLFAAGPGRQIVKLRFTIAANAVGGPTFLTFGSTPTPSSFSDAFGVPIEVVFVPGSVTIEAAAPSVTISGQVTKPNGQALGGAQVVVLDSQNVRRLATTSTFGFYTVDDIPANQTYSVAVSSRRYRFTPVNNLMVGTSNVVDLNFVGQE